MSTKFFTNSENNTLLSKFEGIFKYTKVHYFDVLVGYFYSSGYFRVRKYLDEVSKIRILVGIDIDYLISEAARKGLEFNFNTEVTKEEYIRLLKEDIQEADYKRDVEEGIVQFIEDIVSGKLELKAHPDKNIHAKIYIFRPEEFNQHNSGSVITGSSNLTVPGLEKNFEYNVELRDYQDVEYSTITFNKLWEEGIPVEKELFQQAKQSTYLNDKFTPFEIYIKFLIEYFGSSIEYDPELAGDLPKGYKKLQYQTEAVVQGMYYLKKHNGFFLADVVGLGKTVIATMIINRFYWTNGYRTKTLIVYPPALKKSWKDTIHDFQVPNVDFISNGSIHKIEHPEDYDLVVVDEAHKFRSDTSEMFYLLQKLCKTPRKRKGYDGTDRKKVMLISATPLNNKPEDIRNLLYLFQDARSATLDIPNLQHFFTPLIKRYNNLKQSNSKLDIAIGVKGIYEQIRRKILEQVIIRRTRTDILKTPDYKKDIEAQGLSFPNIQTPRPILYELDTNLEELFDRTVLFLQNPKNGLNYFRYQAIKYLIPDIRKQYKQAEMISELLAGIIRTMLVKRLDSSFYAFKKSLNRFCNANRAMQQMFKNDRIYIAPDLKGKVTDYILNDDEEALIKLIEETGGDAVRVFSNDDFLPAYLEGLNHDQNILDDLVSCWNKIDYDPKLDKFIEVLKNELFDKNINDNGKLIVFSEAKDTTSYLACKLKDVLKQNILAVDSSNQSDVADTVFANFDANYKGVQKDDYQIVITTEVLAEGVNLHRSNIILNYDIPWNATRLMQRIGRVNRVGTKSETIYIYNFFPTAKTDGQISLNKKAYIKLQAFHSALGEDSQVYSSEEETDSYGMFERLPEEDRDEKLIFLTELRDFKENQPEEYHRIKNMPLRARTGRRDRTRKGSTITYLKTPKRDGFYYFYKDDSSEELTFVDAAHIFKANIAEKPKTLHSKHHDHIDAAQKMFNDELSLTALGDKRSIKLGPNETRAIAYLSTFARSEFPNEPDAEKLKLAVLAVKRGVFQKLQREVNKQIKKNKKEKMKRLDAFKLLMEIVNEFPLAQTKGDDLADKKAKFKNKEAKAEIIISESFSA